MFYEMEALDSFFFRNPAPFEAEGDTTVLHSIFPPLPSTYSGAFQPLMKGGQGKKTRLRIGFNGIAVDEKYYFPLPQDLYTVYNHGAGQYEAKRKSFVKNTLTSYPLPYRMCIPEKDSKKEKGEKDWYLSEAEMQVWMEAESADLACMDLNSKLVRERKLGIAVDEISGTAQEHRIYETLYIRPQKGVKLVADVQGERKIDCGIIKLGGEGRLAAFAGQNRQVGLEPLTAAGKEKVTYFKMYLATPAIFEKGWLPGWMDEKSQTGFFAFKNKRVKVRLIAACVGKMVPCGGFGYRKVKADKAQDGPEEKWEWGPRELRLAVPAGSVYYFELLSGTYEDVVKLFHKKCISDYREGLGFQYQMFNRTRYCDRGFGYALIGRVDKEQEELFYV